MGNISKGTDLHQAIEEGLAHGGLVHKSDTVPAMLSAGTYEAPPHLVKKYGTEFLDTLNQGLVALTDIVPSNGGFVNGGMVDNKHTIEEQENNG